jgi:hypothetical protein
MVGTWELCDGLFQKVVIYLSSRIWIFLHIHGVELVPIVASIAGVNNWVL